MAEFGDQPVIYSRATVSDMTAKQYVFLISSEGGGIDQAVEGNVNTIQGVLQNAPGNGEIASVLVMGVTKLRAGAAITADALLTSNTSGRAIAAASGDAICGRALEAAAGNNDIITAVIWPAFLRALVLTLWKIARLRR